MALKKELNSCEISYEILRNPTKFPTKSYEILRNFLRNPAKLPTKSYEISYEILQNFLRNPAKCPTKSYEISYEIVRNPTIWRRAFTALPSCELLLVKTTTLETYVSPQRNSATTTWVGVAVGVRGDWRL